MFPEAFVAFVAFVQVAGAAPAVVDQPQVDLAFRVVDLVGVFANATLGGIIARTHRLDVVGFATLAILSGLGGGMIRDTLLQQGPPVALTDYAYVLTALTAAVLTFVLRVDGRLWQRLWPALDALALGSWAAAGALKTLSSGLGWLPAILLGTITAVGGGALRDVVLQRVPAVLGGSTLYATCAVAASGVMVVGFHYGRPEAGLVAGTAVGAGLCLLARRYRWILPDSDAWSPASVVPRGARSALRTRARALRKRRASRAPRSGRSARSARSARSDQSDQSARSARPRRRPGPDRSDGDDPGR